MEDIKSDLTPSTPGSEAEEQLLGVVAGKAKSSTSELGVRGGWPCGVPDPGRDGSVRDESEECRVRVICPVVQCASGV